MNYGDIQIRQKALTRRRDRAATILSGLISGHLASPNQDKIHPEDLVRESLLITDMLYEWSKKDPKELPRELFEEKR
ncbi:hypothetical protein AB3N61_09360 [Leptospira sp. WS58.C1]|uniref:hypothetical protein n=1 Tax=Leptospira cinconiae TaxID=3235173 RepID=UPI00349EB206